MEEGSGGGRAPGALSLQPENRVKKKDQKLLGFS
jgi:hypothetical protein